MRGALPGRGFGRNDDQAPFLMIKARRRIGSSLRQKGLLRCAHSRVLLTRREAQRPSNETNLSVSFSPIRRVMAQVANVAIKLLNFIAHLSREGWEMWTSNVSSDHLVDPLSDFHFTK